MSWLTKRWQADEDLISNAHQGVEGTSDGDIAAALLIELAMQPKNTRHDNGGDR